MIWRPKNGQRVEIRYSAKTRHLHRYHGARGVVLKAGRGNKNINALVMLDSGEEIVVPRGQLFEERQLTLDQVNLIQEDEPPPKRRHRDRRPLHIRIEKMAMSSCPTTPIMLEWAEDARALWEKVREYEEKEKVS